MRNKLLELEYNNGVSVTLYLRVDFTFFPEE